MGRSRIEKKIGENLILVQEGGLEPPSSFEGWLLRPVRLPIPPLLHNLKEPILFRPR